MILQFAYNLLMPALDENRDEMTYQRLARQSRAGLSSICEASTLANCYLSRRPLPTHYTKLAIFPWR
jgi:hypothetical protein